jgi:hypothetical protein
MRDGEGKALLRHWPDTTTLFKLPSGRRFLKAFPPGRLVTFVVFGTNSPVTEPDGAYFDIHPSSTPGLIPSVDVLFIEICGSGLANLRDKRSRYLPVHEARGIEFTKSWFAKSIKRPGAGGLWPAWKVMGLTSPPAHKLCALIRTVRVVYVVTDAMLAQLTMAEVPRGHEFFVSDSWFRKSVAAWPAAEPGGGWAGYKHKFPALTNAVKKADATRFFDLNQHFLA